MAIKVSLVQLGNEFNSIKTNWLKHLKGEKIDFRIDFAIDTAIKIYADNTLVLFPDAFVTGDWVQFDNDCLQDYNVGDSIHITDTTPGVNTGDYTILEKTDNRTLRLDHTFSNGVITDGEVYINDTFNTDKVKFRFNFIENGSAADFHSLIDGNIQELNAAGLSYTNTTPINFIPAGQKSWQLCDAAIAGSGLDSDGNPTFSITGHFTLTPFITYDQWDNLIANIPPNYFLDFNCLKLAYRIEASYVGRSPYINQFFEDSSTLGDSGWYNEQFNNRPTNYYVDSVVLEDVSSNVIDEFEATTADQTFTAVIKNTSDTPFTSATKFLTQFYISLDSQDQYKNNGKTVDANFRQDRCLQTVGAGAINGEQYGITGRQVLKSISATLDSTSQITVTGTIKFDSTLVAYLKTINNPRYILEIITGTDINLSGSSQTVSSGNYPYGIAYDPINNRMYVTNTIPGTVSVLDGANNLVTTITAGTTPNHIAYDSVNKRMYVVNSGSNNVTVIKCSDYSILATVSVGNSPVGIAFDSLNARMYVCNSGSISGNSVSVIRCSDNTVIATISSITTAWMCCFDSFNNRIYVSKSSGEVKQIDTSSNTVTATITVGTTPRGLAYDSVNKRVFVCNEGGTTISVIKTSDNSVTSITVDSFPQDIIYEPTTKKMYVAHNVTGVITIINAFTKTVEKTITLPQDSEGVAYNPVNYSLYVCSGIGGGSGGTFVTIIGLGTEANDIRVLLPLSKSDFFIDFSDPTMVSATSLFLRHTEDDVTTQGTTTPEVMPEDEVVAYNEFYIDTTGRTSDTIVLTGLTMKIKAKKGNSEFDLDSFSLSPVDANINTTIARIFHIPVSELRKNIIIKRRTDLDNSGKIYYSVNFPFKIRWEYWIALATANLEFFDAAVAQNGLNQDWYRYSQGSGWEIDYELIINVSKNGHALSYSFPTQITIDDYDSNSDWDTKSIKSYDGSTELTSGGNKYIMGYKDTKIVAFFHANGFDVSGVAGHYQINMLIEVFEQGGIAGQRRMSSKWVSLSDTWFRSIDSSNKTNVVVDTIANTITGTVNVAADLIPSSATKFKITARLYEANGGNLIGETIKETFLLIRDNPIPIGTSVTIPNNPLPGCCNDFALKVLADNSGDSLKNDKNTVIWNLDASTTSATLYLKKWINGSWVTQATISDNTYGTYGSLGYKTNSFGQKFIKLEINWAAVLSGKGTGSYKVTCTYTNGIFGANSVDSNEFCLNTYTPLLADNTVRLEYWLSGTIGDINDDNKIKDFGDQIIYNSLRLRGYFGYPKATYKEETVQYNTGQFVFVEDEQTPVFKLELQMLPFFIHEILRTEFMMADTLAITDYNSKNNGAFVQKYVRKNSGYEPKWSELQSNLASIELSFIQQINRFRKFRD